MFEIVASILWTPLIKPVFPEYATNNRGDDSEFAQCDFQWNAESIKQATNTMTRWYRWPAMRTFEFWSIRILFVSFIYLSTYITRNTCTQQPLARFTVCHSRFCLTLVLFISGISKETFWERKYLHYSQFSRNSRKPS